MRGAPRCGHRGDMSTAANRLRLGALRAATLTDDGDGRPAALARRGHADVARRRRPPRAARAGATASRPPASRSPPPPACGARRAARPPSRSRSRCRAAWPGRTARSPRCARWIRRPTASRSPAPSCCGPRSPPCRRASGRSARTCAWPRCRRGRRRLPRGGRPGRAHGAALGRAAPPRPARSRSPPSRRPRTRKRRCGSASRSSSSSGGWRPGRSSVPPMGERPLIIVDPLPRTLDMICAPDVRARLEALGRLEVADAAPMPAARVDGSCPTPSPSIGQTDLPAERLARAGACGSSSTSRATSCPTWTTPRRAPAASTCCARARRSPTPWPRARWGWRSTSRAGSAPPTGRCGRAARRTGWTPTPARSCSRAARWASSASATSAGRCAGCSRRCAARSASSTRGCRRRRSGARTPSPSALDELLRASRVVFVLAAATSDNEGFLGERELRLIPPGGVLALMSRAGVVDFDALVRVVAEGRLRAAVDVFPEEPLPGGPPDPRARRRAALAAPRGRDARGVPRDRPPRRRRPRARAARAAARAVPPRGAGDRRADAPPPVARS